MCSPQSPAPDDPQGLVASSQEVGLLARSGVLMIRGYQRTLSRVLPPSCRFYPSCSEYTLIAIKRYGLWRGCWLGAKRIARCHPFHPGGIDHVP